MCSCKISIGARGSRLSRAQVAEVEHEISTIHPSIQFISTWIETLGDRDKTTPLWAVDRSDFFSFEIDQRQLAGEFRIAIHSAKDLPSPLPRGLQLVALTKGLTAKDSIVMPLGATIETLPKNPIIGSSSHRREAAVLALRPDAVPISIRGTIDERLHLLKQARVDAIVVAEAAILRLNLHHLNRRELDHETEKYQGQLAVIARDNDEEMRILFSEIDSRHP